MKLRPAALCLALAAGQAAPAWAQGADTYRWVDQRGQVHYADRPPSDAGKAAVKQFGDAPADTAPAYAVRKAAADFPVELYTSESCGGLCDEARGFLAQRGVPYTERKLANEADVEAYRTRFDAPEEVPAISVGRRTDRGFEPGRWTRMLDSAGYPRTPLPPR